MPTIHHPVLKRELEVSEEQAEVFTTNPEVPWVRGPLPSTKTKKFAKARKPTATKHVPEEGTPPPPSEED